MTLALEKEIRQTNHVKVVVKDGNFIVTSENGVKFYDLDTKGDLVVTSITEQLVCQNIELSNGNIFHEDGTIVLRGDYYTPASTAFYIEKNIKSSDFIGWLIDASTKDDQDLVDYVNDFPTHPRDENSQGFAQHLLSPKGMLPININKFKVAFFQIRDQEMVVCGSM